MSTIETKNLTYSFSTNETVVNNVNLQIPDGSIYGFLGPNGAGKTTTIRLLVGLLKKQEGEIEIFGKDFHKNRIEILKNIGTLIESPSLYGHLTAQENLEIYQKIYQCPKNRIQEVLEIVGLANTGKKKAGKFSLGMKQRLSIAMALLHQPKILILDEPTNGLDPNGIIEIRELLKKLNHEFKITILVSSHLLSEIEKLVTHIGIIHKGNILFQGTLNELQQKQTEKSSIGIESNQNEKVKSILLLNGITSEIVKELVVFPLIEKNKIAELIKQIVNENIEVYQIKTLKNDLESIFIDLVK